ncbi:MAG TPA: ATP phosphoribosyltransferase regulatory subunit [Gammaproteobacteria bacterium]|nr:ATP phosphoribosyltransferase regulatory subunit [Gammaproteobacteria bacterium]
MTPSDERWLLPEGIEELLPPQAARMERLRRTILDLYHGWGYELVLPPFIEYLETLLTGTGNDLDLQTFKLTDQLSGRMMGVRADMTPQVARIDACHLRRETPTRLCYMGTVLRTRPAGITGSRSPLQVGVELYGHDGVASDVEVLRLMVETMAVSGIERLHLDLGHVGIFRALARQADLDGRQESALFDALQRKARPEIESLLGQLGLPSGISRMLTSLATLNGGEEILDQAERTLQEGTSELHAALTNLREVARQLRSHLPELALHFDLAELRGYRYHTGVVFAVYVPGHGQAVAQGGRYDDIGRVFGRSRPATGFSTDLKTLVSLAPGEGEPRRKGILAPAGTSPDLLQAVRELRGQGERVIELLPGQSGDAAALDCDRHLVLRDGGWQVESLSG